MPETVDQEIRTLQSIFWSERDPDGLAFAPLADAFRRKGEVREALDLLTDGVSRHPDYATGHVVATRLYVDQGMHSEAELAARRVLELDPENLVALSALVSVLSERGETGEAARHKTTLFAADPDSEEARVVADSDLGTVGDETGDDPPEITELVPETMYGEVDASLLDIDGPTVDPEGGPEDDARAEEELDQGVAGELAADPLDLTNLSFGHDDESASVDDESSGDDEPVDLASLAPDEDPAEVTDIAVLAPDEEPDEVVDLAALAPDGEPDEVVDLAVLAPDEEPDEVVDLAALAPDEETDHVADTVALAPDDVADIASLAPDVGGEEDVVELAALAPEASVEELAEKMELAEEMELAAAEEDGDDDDPTDPIYTRTLADLYIKQGFHDKALEVLKHIQERQPDATDLAERIAALETGEVPESGFGSKGGSTAAADAPPTPTTASIPEDPAGQAEDDVERRARELAEAGDDHAMDTPFAWGDADEQPADSEHGDAGIGSYLEGLLEWENRSES